MERVAVIGLGQFGHRIALRLAELGAEVLAIDSDPNVIEMSRSKVSQAIQLDATDEGAFQASGVDEVDTVLRLVLIPRGCGSMGRSTIYTFTLCTQ